MTPENEKNSATGHNQSDFAGTNTDRYGAPKPADQQDNPIQDEEAQNVTESTERISGEEADKARTKANQSD